MIRYSALPDGTAMTQLVADWIKAYEGFRPLVYDDYPNVDTPEIDGKVSIGYGLNLQAEGVGDHNLALVLDELGVFAASNANAPAGESAEERSARHKAIVAEFRKIIDDNDKLRELQDALDMELQKYVADAEFALDRDQATNVIHRFVNGFKDVGGYSLQGTAKDVEDRLRAPDMYGVSYGITIGRNTFEFAALVSLAYNGPRTIGHGLRTALRDGDRAEAWFEIRYNTAKKTQLGVAKRRYAEAELFGLYDGSTGELTPEQADEEARGVYEMYTRHRAQIIEYEYWTGAGAPLYVKGAARANMIAQANADYVQENGDSLPLLPTGSEVRSLEASFERAFDYLETTYLTSLGEQFAGVIDFRDIHVGGEGVDLLLGTRRDGWQLIDERAPASAGGDRAELFLAGASRDVVHGRGGDDIIYGEDGSDLLWGGTGADRLFGGAGDDELHGGTGGNLLYPQSGEGDEADGAADILDGGAGFDTYYVDGGDVIVDSDGQGRVVFRGEVLHGGIEERDGSFTSHDGRFVYELAGGALTVSEVGKDGVLTIRDFNNRDLGITFSQTPAPPSVIVTGTDGHDMYQRIYGRLHKYLWDGGLFAVNGTKIETILQFEPNGFYGGEGNDVLGVGEEGSHLVTDAIQLYGEAGDDQLFSASGDDWLDGGEGHDRATGSAGRDTLLGRDGNDVLSGEEDEDLGVGGAGDDLILGGAGIDLLSGGEGNDTLYGDGRTGAAFMGWDGETSTAYFFSDLDTYYFTAAEIGSNQFYFVLEAGVDEAGDDVLFGGAGADNLYGGAGNDTLYGGSEMDALYGEAGDDQLVGGGGNDWLWGDHNAETVSSDGAVVYTHEDTLTFHWREHPVGTELEGNDSLEGGAGDDRLFGGGGHDRLDGGSGLDYLDGGSGNDEYIFRPGWELAVIEDESGTDTLRFEGIRPTDLAFSQSGGNLLITSLVDGSELYIQGWFSRAEPPIDLVLFSDGTGWTSAHLTGLVQGTVGTEGDDQLHAAADVAELAGGLGADSYSLDGASGHLTIRDDAADGAVNTVTLPLGVSSADLVVQRSDDDLLLTWGGGNDSVALTGYYLAPETWTFLLGSGQEVTVADLIDRAADDASMVTDEWAAFEQLHYARLATEARERNTGYLGIDGGQIDRQGYLTTVSDPVTTGPIDVGGEMVWLPVSFGNAGSYSFEWQGLPPELREMRVAVVTQNTGDAGETVSRISGWNYSDYWHTGSLQVADSALLTPGRYEVTISHIEADTQYGIEHPVWVNKTTYFIQKTYGGAGADVVLPASGITGSAISLIDGGGGNDTLNGGGAADFLYGGDDHDDLIGHDGADVLVGGAGDDMLYGGSGADTYLFGFDSAGHDNIVDDGLFSDDAVYSTLIELHGMTREQADEWLRTADDAAVSQMFGEVERATDVLRVNAALGEVEFRWEMPDDEGRRGIVIESAANPDASTTIWLRGPNDPVGFGVEQFEFSDTTLSLDDVVGLLPYMPDGVIYGTAFDDDIDGSAADDTIVGYSGEDFVTGREGDDVYLFNAGDGFAYLADDIEETGEGGTDTLSLGGGIVPEGISAAMQVYQYGGANYFVLELQLGGDAIEVDWRVSEVQDGESVVRHLGLERLQFVGADGARVFDVDGLVAERFDELIAAGEAGSPVPLFTAEALAAFDLTAQQALAGGEAAVSYGLYGEFRDLNLAPEIIGSIDDQSASAGEAFSFEFPVGTFVDYDGDELIYSAQLADGSSLPQWLSFDPATASFGGTPSDDDAGTLELVVTASDPSGLTANAGFTLTVAEQQAQNIVTGTAGSDVLLGTEAADRLIGGAGNDDYLVNHAGDEIIELGGEGYDRVYSYVDYTLPDHVDELHLADSGDLAAAGNDGDNHLFGNAGANVLSGLAGNDYLGGGAGDDILYGGAGNDELSGDAGSDHMQGGAGDDWYHVDQAGDVVIEAADAGYDQVFSAIDYALTDNVEMLRLLGEADLLGTGNAGDNVVFGNSGANVLAGLDGADYLGGGAGNDTLYGGAGNDELSGEAGADHMEGGSGDDWYHVDDVGDTVVEAADSGNDQVFSTIDYILPDHVEALRLEGAADLAGTGNALNNVMLGNAGADVLTGLAGDDLLVGGDGDDVLTGGSGNDELSGGNGSDTYHFARGDGRDLISSHDVTDGHSDALVFGTGITADQLWFRRVGNDLEVAVIGADDAATIDDWYVDAGYHVEEFRTADNQLLLHSQVENLVSAMASFTPPAAGQTSLPPEYAEQLSPVIAANWQ